MLAKTTVEMPNNAEQVSQRVVRQLLEALLFERIIDYRHSQGIFFFNIGELQIKAKGKVAAFGRIRLDSRHTFYFEAGSWLALDALIVIENLEIINAVKTQLSEEIEQTIKLSRWNKENLCPLQSRRNLSYRELESAIDEGHPYHPCFKARTGFDIKDHMHYGPEYANTFNLHWLAVQTRYIHNQFNCETSTSNQELNLHHQFWLAELGSETWGKLRKCLIDSGGHWQNYRLLPAHPWQIKKLQKQLQVPLKSGAIIDLGKAGDEYQASISVRTLINVTRPEKANIKLPLNMVNSSSLRTIESHSISTAPLLSQWLNKMIQGDRFLSQGSILREYAGIRLQADKSKMGDELPRWLNQLDGQLGVIFRESIEKHHQGENALPFVALSLIENDRLPFIHPWIKHYGCEAWLRQLIKTTVIPVWHLLVHHGIAVEAHAQNMILIHQDGWPHRIVLRDFHESLEFVYEYLNQAEIAPDFPQLDPCYAEAKPNQFYWMDDIEALRELLVDTLFVFNLSELSSLLENYYAYKESLFWRLVQTEMQGYAKGCNTDEQRIAVLDIYKNRIQTESLLRKKLSGKSDKEFHHQTANALSDNFFEIQGDTKDQEDQKKPG